MGPLITFQSELLVCNLGIVSNIRLIMLKDYCYCLECNMNFRKEQATTLKKMSGPKTLLYCCSVILATVRNIREVFRV